MKNSTKKNTGRPAQLIKRENATGIRLTKAERFIIYQKARRTGMNLTTYIREAALHGSISARLTEEERQIGRELIQMSNDIHQLVLVAREAGMLKATLHYETLRSKIDQVLNRFSHDK